MPVELVSIGGSGSGVGDGGGAGIAGSVMPVEFASSGCAVVVRAGGVSGGELLSQLPGQCVDVSPSPRKLELVERGRGMFMGALLPRLLPDPLGRTLRLLAALVDCWQC